MSEAVHARLRSEDSAGIRGWEPANDLRGSARRGTALPPRGLEDAGGGAWMAHVAPATFSRVVLEDLWEVAGRDRLMVVVTSDADEALARTVVNVAATPRRCEIVVAAKAAADDVRSRYRVVHEPDVRWAVVGTALRLRPGDLMVLVAEGMAATALFAQALAWRGSWRRPEDVLVAR